MLEIGTYECLCSIGKWHWTHARRIEEHKDVDASAYKAFSDLVVVRVKAEAGEEQTEGQQRESEEEQRPSAILVNGERTWDSKDPIDETGTERE